VPIDVLQILDHKSGTVLIMGLIWAKHISHEQKEWRSTVKLNTECATHILIFSVDLS
jgi:hypothetical protein